MKTASDKKPTKVKKITVRLDENGTLSISVDSDSKESPLRYNDRTVSMGVRAEGVTADIFIALLSVVKVHNTAEAEIVRKIDSLIQNFFVGDEIMMKDLVSLSI